MQIDIALCAHDFELSGVVHSCFHHTINVMSDKARIYSIHQDPPDRPPYGIILPDGTGTLLWNQLVPGMRVLHLDQALFFGKQGIKLALERAQPYDSRDPRPFVNPNTVNPAQITVLSQLVEQECASRAHMWPEGLRSELDLRYAAFSKAFSGRGNLPRAVMKLLGFGIGLTPSGDDFLSGFIIGCMRLGVNPMRLGQLAALVSSQSKQRTTDISHAMLQAALENRVGAWTWTLLDSLQIGASDALCESFQGLMRVGATSGLECTVGILHAFGCFEEWNEEGEHIGASY